MNKIKIGCVYCINNIITGRKYVGSTNHLEQRITKHYSGLRHQTHRNKMIQEDFNLYGESSFYVDNLFYTDDVVELKKLKIYI